MGNKLPYVEIYVDGSGTNGVGPGGWGAVLYHGPFDYEERISGRIPPPCTNQSAEIMAVVKALEHLKEKSKVVVFSDSAYVVNCINQQWRKNWRRNGWKNARGFPVANKELWNQLHDLIDQHYVEFVKVKAHSGNSANDIADNLASKARKGR